MYLPFILFSCNALTAKDEYWQRNEKDGFSLCVSRSDHTYFHSPLYFQSLLKWSDVTWMWKETRFYDQTVYVYELNTTSNITTINNHLHLFYHCHRVIFTKHEQKFWSGQTNQSRKQLTMSGRFLLGSLVLATLLIFIVAEWLSCELVRREKEARRDMHGVDYRVGRQKIANGHKSREKWQESLCYWHIMYYPINYVGY